MIATPYLALGAAVSIALAATGGYFHGKHVAEGEHAAKDLKQAQAIEAERQARQSRINELEVANAGLEAQRQEEVRYVYREIPKVVRGDPVYRNVCIGDDGVRLIDRATDIARRGGAEAPAGAADGSASGRPDDGSGDGKAKR